MSFSSSLITNVQVQCKRSELTIHWSSTAAADRCFQVYVDRVLKWQGYSHYCILPHSSSSIPRNTCVEVGTVEHSEAYSDFSQQLIGSYGTGDRIQLSWYGGSYLDLSSSDSVTGYSILGSRSEDGLGRAAVLADVAAYPGSWKTDGYGMGGYGDGGFGRSSTFYSWTSGRLSAGRWYFAVVPHNLAGNVGTVGSSASFSIQTPPLPLSVDSLGVVYSGLATRTAQLHWNPRPTS